MIFDCVLYFISLLFLTCFVECIFVVVVVDVMKKKEKGNQRRLACFSSVVLFDLISCVYEFFLFILSTKVEREKEYIQCSYTSSHSDSFAWNCKCFNVHT